MTYEELDKLVKKQKLKILGGFFPNNNDGIPSGIKTLILLGPDEPNFWKHFILSPEWKKEEINPLDMWSYRVINEIAKNLNFISLFSIWNTSAPFFQMGYSFRFCVAKSSVFISSQKCWVNGLL